MNSKSLLLIAAIGAFGYWAYRNGWGALVGMCPAGYQVVQNMLPSCRNAANLAYDMGQCGSSNVSATFPNVWGCVNGVLTEVPSSPKWP